jgi:hypothetical protein
MILLYLVGAEERGRTRAVDRRCDCYLASVRPNCGYPNYILRENRTKSAGIATRKTETANNFLARYDSVTMSHRVPTERRRCTQIFGVSSIGSNNCRIAAACDLESVGSLQDRHLI